jgi:hypothetical protein
MQVSAASCEGCRHANRSDYVTSLRAAGEVAVSAAGGIFGAEMHETTLSRAERL